MKVDFSKKFVDFEGEVLNDLKGKPANLKGVALDALMAQFKDEQNLAGEEKVKRYALAMKISKEVDCDLTVEEISLLKKLIGKAYAPLIVGQAWDMLEGK